MRARGTQDADAFFSCTLVRARAPRANPPPPSTVFATALLRLLALSRCFLALNSDFFRPDKRALLAEAVAEIGRVLGDAADVQRLREGYGQIMK